MSYKIRNNAKKVVNVAELLVAAPGLEHAHLRPAVVARHRVVRRRVVRVGAHRGVHGARAVRRAVLHHQRAKLVRVVLVSTTDGQRQKT